MNHVNIDMPTLSAIKLVISFSKEEIIEAYEHAEEHKKVSLIYNL